MRAFLSARFRQPHPGPPRGGEGGGALDRVGEADDGVDGADAEGGVGFEVQDAGDVSQGTREGLLGVGFAVVAVGGARWRRGRAWMWGWVSQTRRVRGSLRQAAGGDGVGVGAEEEVEAGVVLGGEGLRSGDFGLRIGGGGWRLIGRHLGKYTASER